MPDQRPRCRARGRTLAQLTLLALGVLILLPNAPGPGWGSVVGAPSSAGATLRTLSSSTRLSWGEFHQNPQLTGYDPNSSLSVSNAGQLGVRWSTDLYGAALDSPVVAYSKGLGVPVAYIGTEGGNVLAINVSDGRILWGAWLGSPIRGTPIVVGGSIFVGTFENPEIVKLNATTGAVDCRVPVPAPIEGSPVVGLTEWGRQLLFVGTLDNAVRSGPFVAIATKDCAPVWSFSSYQNPIAGSWDAASYATTAQGGRMVLFGTADTDAAVYALNATTGKAVWHYNTSNPSPHIYDVGAGGTVSPPGANGFTGGVVYVPSKYGILYALNLTTGKLIWQYNYSSQLQLPLTGRSTPALEGKNLIFGVGDGLVDIDARSGVLLWHAPDPTGTEVISSPSILGSASKAIVVYGELDGSIDVISEASHAALFRYTTGGYITGSPAVFENNILVGSSDGFLYDISLHGGTNGSLPTTGLTWPVDGSILANRSGPLTVNGSATAPNGVADVEVAVQANGTGGAWYDARTRTWTAGPVASPATLASPGSNSSLWNFSFPVAGGGGSYKVVAYAIDTGGQSDILTAATEFGVLSNTKGPHLKLSVGFVAPGQSFSVTGGGFLPGERVTFALGNGPPLASVNVTARGSLPSISIRLPINTSFGRTTLVAFGLNSSRTAGATIVIANTWTMGGADSAHTAYDPNDPILYDHVEIETGTWMRVAWRFVAGSSIVGSPAIANGIAYLADTAGQFYAIDQMNGGSLWSFTPAHPSAIYAAPAVDPSAGLAILPYANGTLTAVSFARHAPVWNLSLGGNLSGPVLAGSMVYVASRNGSVAAVNETTGHLAWWTSLGTTLWASPAIDPSSGGLIEGGLDGRVRDLQLSNGAVSWQSGRLGGSIYNPAIVAGGVAYFETTSGNVSALRLSSHSRVWTVNLGANLTVPAALATAGTGAGNGPELFVGSPNGSVDLIRAGTGNITFRLRGTTAIGAVVATDGTVIYVTAKGSVQGARAYAGIKVWGTLLHANFGGSLAVVDGTVYTGDLGGILTAYTTFGQSPD